METIDKIFIINLDKDIERWKNCLLQLKKYNITNFERFPAIQPVFKNINKKLYSQFQYCKSVRKAVIRQKKKMPLEKKKYICGSLGCKFSHMEILKIAIKNKYKRILILEDDFVFIDNFTKELKNLINNIENIDWKFLLLFGNNLNRTKKI